MIRINLIPKEERKKVRVKRARGPKRVGVMGLDLIISFVIFILAIGVLFFMNSSYTKNIEKLNRDIVTARKELKKLQKEVAVVKNIERKKAELNVLVNIVKGLNSNRSLMVHMMDEINRRLPDYVWLRKVTDKGNSVSLKGYTFSNLIVSDLMIRLEKSVYFSNVKLNELKNSLVEGHSVMEFSIDATLLPQGG
ncbi:PilN domain-containing protein [candidate division WOR-3 bacterium]|nr:PilN domain-containing protein [candidate division WOR-3 bacterium]